MLLQIIHQNLWVINSKKSNFKIQGDARPPALLPTPAASNIGESDRKKEQSLNNGSIFTKS